MKFLIIKKLKKKKQNSSKILRVIEAITHLSTV